MDVDKIWLALCAWGAGIIVAFLGFLDSNEKFDARKFGASVIRALVAGIVWAFSYPATGVLTFAAILGAVASGPFFDTVINKIGSLAGNPQFPLPPSNQSSSIPRSGGTAGAQP